VERENSESVCLVPLLNARQKREFLVECAVWLVALGYFWFWWLDPAHIIGLTGYALVSVVLLWVTLLPLYFIVIVHGAKKPQGTLYLPTGSRVAMVVTKAPSEPFNVVAQTLDAMLMQDTPHDTWLADEDPSPDTLEWCAARGIRVSTRRGRADYLRATWPRRARCKEGNLAFFYDHYGYEFYDFVAQFDADHVPEPSYLREVLKPFADPTVGYVSAPSICDKNASKSWSARGRLFVEATLHGPLQAGYNAGWAPLCIGSHYAVRTAALKQIGGLGPELAEDHSTTLMMNAGGWRGVHAIDAIAHGEGPCTFADLITQEFQWSRSLATILLQYTPHYLPRLSARLKFQFVFSQLWYFLFSLFMALMFALPVVELVYRVTFVNVAFPPFVLHVAPLSIILVVIAHRMRASGSNRPSDAKVLSWEGLLFVLARWPWSLAGTMAALRDWATGSFVDFRVTPKGRDPAGPLPVRVLAPYAAMSVGSALPALLIRNAGAARGFYMFAIYNATLYAILLVAVMAAHLREAGIPLIARSSAALKVASLATLLFAAPVAAATVRATDGLEALAWGVGPISFFQVIYGAAGAGQSVRRIKFNLNWLGG